MVDKPVRTFMPFRYVIAVSALITLLMVVAVVFFGTSAVNGFTKAQEDWRKKYIASVLVSDQLNEVSNLLGYGGAIHNFKNYLLRRDDHYREKCASDIANATFILTELSKVLTLPEDQKALATITETIEKYRVRLQTATDLISQNKALEQIDTIVRVDDSGALKALTYLREKILSQAHMTEQEASRSLKEAITFSKLGFLILFLIASGGGITTFFFVRLLQIRSAEKDARRQVDELFYTLPDAALCVGLDGSILKANASARAMFGYELDEFLALKVEDLVPEHIRERHVDFRNHYIQAPQSRPMAKGSDLVAQHKDGHMLHADISLVVAEENPERQFVIAILRDNTLRHQTEVELQGYNTALKRLHEISTENDLDLKTRFSQLLALGCEIFSLETGIISNIEAENYRVDYIVGPQGCPEPGTVFELGKTFCALAVEADEPLGLEDVQNLDYRNHPCFQEFGVKSYLGAAIAVDGEVYGTISFSAQNARGMDFSDTDKTLIKLFSLWVGSQFSRQLRNQEILASANLVRDAIETIPDGFVLYDNQDRLVLCNEAYRKIYKASAEKMVLGTKFEDILRYGVDKGQYKDEALQGEDREAWIQERIRNHLNPGKPIIQHLGNGHWLRILERQTENGSIVGIRTDITELKNAEQKLLDVSERMELAVEAGKIGVWDWEILENRLTWNPRMYEIYGVKQGTSKVSYDLWRARVHRDDIAATEAKLQACLNGEEPFNAEFRVVWDDGMIKSVQAVAMATFDAQGKPIRMTGLNWDVSAEKERHQVLQAAKEAAETATKAKSEFLANMSHEIRTPLNAVIGLTQLALRDDLSPRQADFMRKIRRSGETLLQLINDILDFSKIEAGKLEMEKRVFRLESALERVNSLVGVKAQEKGLYFSITSAEQIPQFLIGDEIRLVQVLLNLCSNAIKFTEKGTVALTVKNLLKSGNYCVLSFSVQDSGIGLSPKQASRLFEAFTQADGSTTRQYGGTGLGLAISKELVALMGGEISVQSELGQGSTFTFTGEFEIADAEEGEIEEVTQDERLVFSGYPKVLLVEDNDINQEIACEMLETAGAEVAIAQNGRDAVHRVLERKEKFDVVLMDIQMPIMDGFEAATRIRTQYGPNELPIIAMTAHAFKEERDRCFDVGMNDHLAKPVTETDLIKIIAKWAKGIECRGVKMNSEATQVPLSPSTSAQSGVPVKSVREIFAGDDGMDIETALSRVLGREELLTKIILTFTKRYRTIGKDLMDMLSKNLHEDAVRTAHTLKGLAGTMGATHAAEVAKNLEYALREKRSVDYPLAIADLENVLQPIFAGAELLAGSVPAEGQDGPAVAPGPSESADQFNRLEELGELLHKRNTKARKLYAELRPLLTGDAPQLGELDTLIEKFDFKSAAPLFAQVLQNMKSKT